MNEILSNLVVFGTGAACGGVLMSALKNSVIRVMQRVNADVDKAYADSFERMRTKNSELMIAHGNISKRLKDSNAERDYYRNQLANLRALTPPPNFPPVFDPNQLPLPFNDVHGQMLQQAQARAAATHDTINGKSWAAEALRTAGMDAVGEIYENKLLREATPSTFNDRYLLKPTTRCKVPPAGWFCTREDGHEGPCAAHPTNPDEIPHHPV